LQNVSLFFGTVLEKAVQLMLDTAVEH